jgi:hypothetical protein
LVFAGLLKSHGNAVLPVRLATTEFASRYSNLPSSAGSESDENPSAADIRQRFVSYSLRITEPLRHQLQSPE